MSSPSGARRRRPDPPGAGDPALLRQDLAQQPSPRLRRAGRPLPLRGARALLPRPGAPALHPRHTPSPSAPRDHRDRHHQQSDQPDGADLRTARAGGHGGGAGADRARLHRRARDLRDAHVWTRIEALDNRVPAKVQYAAAFETSRLLRHATYWLLARRRTLKVDTAVAEFRAGVHELEVTHRPGALRLLARAVRAGARTATSRPACRPSSPRASRASRRTTPRSTSWSSPLAAHGVTEAARLYFEAGARTGSIGCRQQIDRLPVEGPWQATARTGLRDAALRLHRRLRSACCAAAAAAAPRSAWRLAGVGGQGACAHWQRTLADMRAAGAARFCNAHRRRRVIA